ARAGYRAGLQSWPAAHADRLRRLAGRRGQGLCADAGGLRGRIRQSDIKFIVPEGEGWRVVLADGEITARHVVVALGPWSAELLRPLGYRVPLAFERGYHREFKPNAARQLRRPIHDA